MPTTDEIYRFQLDVIRGAIGGGVPSGIHMFDAALDRDLNRFAYHAAVEGTVLSTYWTLLQFMNKIQGPKYAMSFHRAHASAATARGLVVRGVLANPYLSVPLVTGAVSYGVHSGHSAVAASLPEHEQLGFWQMVGAALGGNVGVGDHGLF